MRIRILACLSIGLMFAACRGPRLYPAMAENPDQYDFYAAVLSFEIESQASQDPATRFFIAFQKEDPPAELLARFASQGFKLEKGSEFQTGKGVKVCINGIARIDDDTVEVSGVRNGAPTSESGRLWTVSRKGVAWVVTKVRLTWEP
ncbi:MAG: hypothetical protein HY924_17110 [Elusimicrobia bacterium]|nr:hypothetical protein [Elusimicrobiota bacterium]